MPAAANPPRFHVVTYAKHDGHDEEDVVAAGTVSIDAADDKAALVEGILSHVDKYQCDGHGQGTKGCTEEHPKAVERVRARLTAEDGKVAVVCRKYHPLVGHGTAEPGKPFEAKWDGVAIRVEVRQIIEEEAEGITDDSVSLVTLRQLQQDFQPKIALADARMRVRSSFAKMVDVHMEAVDEQIAEHRARLADLPGQDDVNSASDEVTASAQAIVDRAQAALTDALANQALDAAGAKQFQADLTAMEGEFAQIFGPFQIIEQQAAALIGVQQNVRELIGAVDEAFEVAATARDDHRTMVFDDQPLHDARAFLEGLLEETRGDDALSNLDDITARSETQRAPIRQSATALGDAVRAAEAEKQAFDARVKILDQWRTDPKPASENLAMTIRSIGGFGEIPLEYWLDRADKAVAGLGALTDVSALRYDDKNAEKKLAKAEKELGPIHATLEALQADLADVVGGAFATCEVDGGVVTAPTAWIDVKHDHADGTFDVELHLVNNDVSPQQVQVLVGEDAPAQGALMLSARGERVTVRIERATSPISCRVVGQGIPDAPDRMRQIDLPSTPLFFEREGATHYAYPMNWTPAALQPGGEIAPLGQQFNGATVARQRLLGIE